MMKCVCVLLISLNHLYHYTVYTAAFATKRHRRKRYAVFRRPGSKTFRHAGLFFSGLKSHIDSDYFIYLSRTKRTTRCVS